MKNILKYKALANFIAKNECFEIIDEKIKCCSCNKLYSYNPNEGVVPLEKHLVTKMHLNKKDIIQKSLVFVKNTKEYNNFNSDLISMFLNLNIPLNVLNNNCFISFIEKYTSQKINSITFYRNTILPKIYFDLKNKIFEYFIDKDFYFIFDETTDIKGRYILNILGGVCEENFKYKTYLLETIELSKTNAENINNEILSLLNLIAKSPLNYNKLKLIISDAAPYAVKVGKLLKILIPEVKHVTCLAHMLHRVAEDLRERSLNADKTISLIKKIFVKNKNNKNIWQENSSIPMHKFPIITRWGTWIEFAIFISENYLEFKKIINLLPNSNEKLMVAQYFNSEELISELNIIVKYKKLIFCIKNLENNNLSTVEQINLFNNALAGNNDLFALRKFNLLVEKNIDLNFFLNYNYILAENKDKIFNYVPLTSIDAERSFSKLNILISDNRQSLTIQNIKMYLFCFLIINKF